VGAADDVDEDERVEGDEGRRPARVDTARGSKAGDEVGGGEDCGRGGGLEHVDRDADGEPGERQGGEGEERPIGAGRVPPVDVGEGGVAPDGSGRMEIGVEAVQLVEAGVVDVAVDIVGEQRR
jgi:hypothetical protein